MRVMIDACVLYPTVMREVVLGCARAELFQPYWSDRILEEWARATRKIGPDAEVLARGEIAQLRAEWPDAAIAVQPEKLKQFWLPDPNDIHVLVAAVVGNCDAILTTNSKDFPKHILNEECLTRVEPDGMLVGFLAAQPDAVSQVALQVLAQANALSPEPWALRALMKKARLPRFGKRLAEIDL